MLLPSDRPAPSDDYVRWIRDYYAVPFSPRQQRRSGALFERFLRSAAPQAPVVDVGAGRADRSAAFPEGAYVGADPIDPVEAGMVAALPAPFVVAWGDRLPFADAQFGSVMLWAVLDQVADRDALYAECARVLRPGGRMCIMTRIVGKGRGGPLAFLGWALSRMRAGDIRGILAVARFTPLHPRAARRLASLTADGLRAEIGARFTDVRMEIVDGYSLILWATR